MSRSALHVHFNPTVRFSPTTIHATDTNAVRELRKNQVKDRASNRNATAALIGGVATVAASGIAAFAEKKHQSNQQNLKSATDFRSNVLPKFDSIAQERLKPANDRHIEVLEGETFWSRVFVVLTAATLADALAIFLGGTLAIPSLITAGTIGGVVILASGAFAGAWYCLDDNAPSSEERESFESASRYYGLKHDLKI